MRARTKGVAWLAGLVALAACAELRSESTITSGDRVIKPLGDTVFVVGGTESDTLLLMPTSVAFLGDEVAVWDRDRAQVLLFGADGTARWSYGGKGSGPGEFAGVTQMSVDDQQRIWVIDPDNARISILDRNGSLVRAFRVPDVGFVDRLTPLARDRALLIGLEPTVHTIDDRGVLLESAAHPYAGYAALHPLSAYNRAVRDPQSDSTVFFFYYGGGFFGTDGALRRGGELRPYVEPIPFPEVTVERTENPSGSITTSSMVNASRLAATGASADGGIVSVLFQGDSEYGHRVIDNYSIGSGQYVGSWLLPDTTSAIAVSKGRVAFIVEDPYPALVVRRAPAD